MLNFATTLRFAPACALLALTLTACETTPEAQSLARKVDLDTAPLTHVVLVQLKDPSRAAELVQDCDRVLPSIEGVAAYSCGVPLLTGRTNVTGDYDVGIYVGFRTEAAYRAYVDDPRHLGLVEGWRDGWKAVRMFDIVEVEPLKLESVKAAPAKVAPAKVAPAKAAPANPAPAPIAPLAPVAPVAPIAPK
ncbi:MAG: Dabb family protein [Planctomycetota bacterium]